MPVIKGKHIHYIKYFPSHIKYSSPNHRILVKCKAKYKHMAVNRKQMVTYPTKKKSCHDQGICHLSYSLNPFSFLSSMVPNVIAAVDVLEYMGKTLRLHSQIATVGFLHVPSRQGTHCCKHIWFGTTHGYYIKHSTVRIKQYLKSYKLH